MVAPKPMPPAAELRRFFDYDPQIGKLYWKKREDRRHDWNTQHAGKEVGSRKPDGYVQVGLNGRVFYLHRIVWIMTYGDGELPAVIDHIDGDRSNNRVE